MPRVRPDGDRTAAEITDAGLTKVNNLPKFTFLELAANISITANGAQKLRAALPKLKAEWDGDAKK